MATINIIKGLIGMEDINTMSNGTTTFSRATSSGGSQTLTKIARNRLITREYDVTQYGTVGNGVSNDTAAIAACIADAVGSGSARIVFPPGYTFAVQPTQADAEIFRLDNFSGPVEIVMTGATIRVTATTSVDPTNAANEKNDCAVFLATTANDITFIGGTFDLNRDYADADPKYGAFKGSICSNVTFRDVTFKDCSNYHGCIKLDSTAGAATGKWHGVTVENCTFETSTCGVWLEGAFRNVNIRGNAFRYMDIAPHDANYEGTFADGYGGGGVKSCQAIKLYASLAYDATDTINGGTVGDTQGIVISGNTFYGCHRAVDADARALGAATDADHYRELVIANNTAWGVAGVYVERWSNVVVEGNVLSGMTGNDVTAYAAIAYENGVTSGNYATSVDFATFIDVTRCHDVVVRGNIIDGKYAFGALTQQVYGIVAGEYSIDVPTNHVALSNNTIRRCYVGLRGKQLYDARIDSNTIKESGYPVQCFAETGASSGRNTESSNASNIFSDNVVYADLLAAAVASGITYAAKFEGSWEICGNTFVGLSTEETDYRLAVLAGFDKNNDLTSEIGTYRFRNNTLRRFNYTPVEVLAGSATHVIELELSNNHFDSEQGSLPAATVGGVLINRPNSTDQLKVTGGGNSSANLRRGVLTSYPSNGSGTEDLDFGGWTTDLSAEAAVSGWRLFDESNANAAALGYGKPFYAGRYVATKTAMIRAASGSGTVVATDFLPYGIILGIGVRNDKLLTMGGSGVGYYVGYANSGAAVVKNYWGSVAALTAETTNDNATTNAAASILARPLNSAEKDLILTSYVSGGADGGTFTDGDVMVTVAYIPLSGNEF